MIKVTDLTKRYGSVTAIDGVSFTVGKGRICGLLGPNGAGKTTTMNVITGCLAPTGGEVTIDGVDLFEEPELAKSRIGYLPEQPPVYPDLTPTEQLRFVAELRGLPKNGFDREIGRVLTAAGLNEYAGRLIRHLSKGYRQRVGLATALVGDPPVLVLDEPTVGLDPRQIIEMRELIRRLGRGHTVILSSHILSEIQAVCDDVIILSKGRLVACDTTESITHLAESVRVRLSFTVNSEPARVKKAVSRLRLRDAAFTALPAGGVLLTLSSANESADRRQVLAALVNGGCDVVSVTGGAATLEESFLRLTESEEDGQ